MTDKQEQRLERLEPYMKDPLVRALLDTIAYCEGTDRPDQFGAGGRDNLCGYGTGFNYKFFDPFASDGHPFRLKTGASAAGRYQFLKSSWAEDIEKNLGLEGFDPKDQDYAAIWQLVAKRRVIEALKRGNLSQVLDKISYEWASIPTSKNQYRYNGQTGPFTPLQFQDFLKRRAKFWKQILDNGQMDTALAQLHAGTPPGLVLVG